ncbi:MAG: hypothetical protein RIS20_846 [Bacteroidota bacterium]
MNRTIPLINYHMKKLVLLFLLTITRTLFAQVTVIHDTILTGAGFPHQCSNPIDTITFTYDGGWASPPPCDSFFGVNLDWVQVYLIDDTIDTNPNVQFDVFFTPLYLDSNGVEQQAWLQYNFLPATINVSGCHQFEMQFLCPEGDTIIFVGTWNIQIADIEALEIPSDRKLVKMTDLMGNECLEEKNRLLIYSYSDGTKEKVFISE